MDTIQQVAQTLPDKPKRAFGLVSLWLDLPNWLRRMFKNPKALTGILILTFFTLMALFSPIIAPTDPQRMVGRPHEAPSAEHPLGTTRQGQDVFNQIVHGSVTTLRVGFATGTIIMVIAIAIGLTAGFVGGVVDEILSLITNIFLVLPGLPLIIVVAAMLDRPGPDTIILVLSLTSWAYGARVLRSQTLALRNSDFVEAARVSGESTWRIIAVEILPNMTSLVVSSWIGAVLFAILAEAGLEFIGLGDPNTVTWGTIIYWAQNNQALLTGAWWTFVPPGIAIALVGLSLTLINYGIDEITNPRLANE
jgi:peptide/nickel transport system permease protein